MNELPLHDYLRDKYAWTDENLYDLDWNAYKGARKQFPKVQAAYTTKLCCKWLPTSKRTALYQISIDQCVLCNSTETQQHVFQCKHSTRQKWRHTFIMNLDKFLLKQNTDPNITEDIKEGLDAWLNERQNNCTKDLQQHIGWESFFYGYIAAKWGHKQQEYISKNKTTGNDSAYTWAMKLIQFFMAAILCCMASTEQLCTRRLRRSKTKHLTQHRSRTKLTK